MLSHDSKFMRQEADAQLGAYGLNPLKTPTLAMQEVGNYKLGRINFYGLKLAIENPRGSYRGSDYRYKTNDHYGYISGYKGADGDEIDVFVGANVSSQKVFVINQNKQDGSFDEHKVMLGYDRLQQAVLAYQLSYETGWQGLGSVVECTIPQLRFWLDRGDKSKPLKSSALPEGGDWELKQSVKDINWIDDAPTLPIEQLLYRIRRVRNGSLLLDAVTVDDIMLGAEIAPVFDALVSPFGKLKPKMEALRKALSRADSEMIDNDSPIEITPPFKRYGSLQVACIFTLKDGQTVSIFFHNPDSTPNKITSTDPMVSWKWMLNKKDITIAVAPEDGKDLSVNEVAKRVMALAKKNAPAFAKANAKKASQESGGLGSSGDGSTTKSKADIIKALKAEISELEQRERELIEQVKEVKANINSGKMDNPPPPIDKDKELNLLRYFYKDLKPHLSSLGWKEDVEDVNGVKKFGKTFSVNNENHIIHLRYYPTTSDKYKVTDESIVFSNCEATGSIIADCDYINHKVKTLIIPTALDTITLQRTARDIDKEASELAKEAISKKQKIAKMNQDQDTEDYFLERINELRHGTEEDYQANIDKLAEDIERADMMPKFDELLKELDNEKDTTVQKAQTAMQGGLF